MTAHDMLSVVDFLSLVGADVLMRGPTHRGFYLARSVMSVLRLAYWCGEYRLVDRCAEWLCEQWLGLGSRAKTGQGGGTQHVGDVQLLEVDGARQPLRHRSRDMYWDSESDTI